MMASRLMALPARISRWSNQLLAAEQCTGFSAEMLAAIMERETLGGESMLLRPRGAAGIGDHGHGYGLFQIDDRSHASFISATDGFGRALWSRADMNCLYAAIHLSKLMELFSDIEMVLCAWNAGQGRAIEALSRFKSGRFSTKTAALDAVTDNGDYVSIVMKQA